MTTAEQEYMDYVLTKMDADSEKPVSAKRLRAALVYAERIIEHKNQEISRLCAKLHQMRQRRQKTRRK